MQAPESTPFANGWVPRPFQQDALDAYHQGHRRQLLIWHRRAGKDNYALNLANELALEEVGTYWHLFPYHTQAKRAIFNGIGNDGVRFIDQAFPERTRTLQQDTLIELPNGSTWQMAGSDAYNRLVGANVRGVIFSEWALCDPAAWNYIKPIIRENGGWVVMITTYRGRNHAYRMAKKLANNPEWYVDIRTVNDTTDQQGRPLITEDDIQAERDEAIEGQGKSESLIQQEYFCNPMAAPEGSVYGRAVEKLDELGRLTAINYDSSKPVHAIWTTQFDDQYSVMFVQHQGSDSFVIGSERFPFMDLSDAIDVVKTGFPWKHCARHVLPHNAGPETIQIFRNADLTTDLAQDSPETIKLARARLGSTFFDSSNRPWCKGDDENNAALVDSLNGYRFPKNKTGGAFQLSTANTWEKHFAKCFETFANWRALSPVTGKPRRPSYRLHDRATVGRLA